MGVELGLWQGTYQNQTMLWLRWWDLEGNLLLTGQERAELEQAQKEQALQQKEQVLQQLEQEREKREQLAARLKLLTPEQLGALGIDPQMLES